METPYSSLTGKDSPPTNSSFAVRKLYELNIQRLSKQIKFFSSVLAAYCIVAFLAVLLFSQARVLGRLIELGTLLFGVGVGLKGLLVHPVEDSTRSLLKQMVGFFAGYLSVLFLLSLLDWPEERTAWIDVSSLSELVSPLLLHFAVTLMLGLIGVSKTHRLHRCLLELESLKVATYREFTFSHNR
jgi:hypothetical protein